MRTLAENEMVTMEKADFLSSYRELIHRSFGEFTGAFRILSDAYVQLRDECRTLDRRLAQGFNIFEILGVAHYEVTTHSALLRELLDSKASHGQGNLFFREFLAVLVQKGILAAQDLPLYTQREFDDYLCDAERAVDTGRIDIIIERVHGDFPFCLIIENKIYAGDQEAQIERYWQDLKKKSIPEGRKKILYLTLRGHPPSEWSISVESKKALSEKGILHCLSYKEDIGAWLTNALPKVQSEKVRHVIEQYLAVLKRL